MSEAATMERPATAPVAERAAGSAVRALGATAQPPERLLREDVIMATVAASGLSRAELIGPGRAIRTVAWRQAAMAVAAGKGLWSLPEIGRAFGGRDHTTVLHALARTGHPRGQVHKTRAVEARGGTDERVAEIERLVRDRLARRRAARLARLAADGSQGEASTPVDVVERAADVPAVVPVDPPAIEPAKDPAKDPARIGPRINPSRVPELRRLRRAGWSFAGLARRYGLDVIEVQAILGEA